MKELQNRIRQMLRDKKTHSRAVALITALSLLVMIIVPDLSAIPGTAMAEEESAGIQAGSYEISADDLTQVSITEVTGGTWKPEMREIDASGSDSVSFDMDVHFRIYDPDHDHIDANHPTIYLKLPKTAINILSFGQGNLTSTTNDTEDAWRNSEFNPNKNSSSDSKSGDLEIVPTGDNDYGFVKLTFTPGYLRYIKEGNGFVTGSFKFNGSATRDATQDGGRTVDLGDLSLKVNFGSKTPSLGKEAVSQREDENGYPILKWKVTVNDLIELDKYTIEDTMLAKAIEGSFSCTNDIFRLENGKLVYDEKINTTTPFEFTYETKVTAQDMADHNEAFDVTNTVKFKEIDKSDKTAKFTITPDSDAKPISKTGTPDYYYSGSRAGESANADYIYWTAEIRKNYSGTLAGTLITDSTTKEGSTTRITPELVTVYDTNGTALNNSEVLEQTDTGWTVKSDVTESYLKIVYRTPVDDKSSYHNTISIGTKSIEAPPVTYDKSSIRNISKTASPGYGSQEAPDGTISEWVDFTIVIDASKQNSNETINGYVINDSAFVSGKYQLLSAKIKTGTNSNYSEVAPGTVLETSGEKQLKIKNEPANMKYVSFTYRVPLNADTPGVEGNRAANNGLGDDCKLMNTYDVEGDGGKVEVPIPGYGGRSTVNVGKNWDNASDPDRTSVQATFQLQKQVVSAGQTLSDGNWINVDGKTVTVNGDSGQTWNSFTDLPEYEYDAANQTRSKIYYRVVETMTIPEGMDNLYQLHATNNDGATGQNISINLTNTWQGINIQGVKYWADDEGLESSRPNAELYLEKSTDNGANWFEVTGSAHNFGTENGQIYEWRSLPKYEGDAEIEYRVRERNTGENYTADYTDARTVKNVYKNMTVSAHKNWSNQPEDRPRSITLTLYRTTDPTQEISQWAKVSDISLGKEDYDAQWTDQPKTDGSGNTYYYRVVETLPEAVRNEYTVSYDQNNVNKDSYSKVVQVTNQWAKRNLTVTKKWTNDTGHEDNRPNVTFHLYRKTDSTDWVLYDSKTLTNAKDGTGNLYAENSTTPNAYTWHGLEKGYQYKVVEDYTEGYITKYNGNQSESPTLNDWDDSVEVTNEADMFTIEVNKQWSGITGSDIPQSVTYRLFYSTDQVNWTKFSDKTVRKNSHNTYPTITWVWMPKTDEHGNKIYYKLEEVSVQRFVTTTDENGVPVDGEKTEVLNPDYIGSNDAGKNKPDKYGEVEFDSERTETEDENTGNINTVFTNIWRKMHLSVEKKWEDGVDPEEYKAVTMRLMQKVGDSAQWTAVSGVDTVQITKESGWKLENAWQNLPRYTAQGDAIFYRVEEVSVTKSDDTVITTPSNWNFYTQPDIVGLNVTGTSVVTNLPKSIKITMHKEWGAFNYSSKPEKYTVNLEANINGSWQKVSVLKTSMSDVFGSVIDPTKELNSSNENEFSWAGLPTRYTDNSGEHDIIYRVTEDTDESFTASYDKTEVRKDDTVTITNNEIAPYTKKAAHSEKNCFTESNGNWDWAQQPNFDALPNDVLLPEQLSSVPVKNVEINGELVECYLFRWRIDLLTNQSQGSTNKTSYKFIDTLTDGSVFVNDQGEFAIVFSDTGYNGQVYAYGKPWYPPDSFSATFSSPTQAKFIAGEGVPYFAYFTATPKSVVDTAIAENGYYSLTNYIIEEKEQEKHVPPKEATLQITSGEDAGYIDKINKTGEITGTQTGTIGADTVAQYELDVNKDGKYLSTGNTVTITDKFRILDYTPYSEIDKALDNEHKQSGRSVTLAPTLQNVKVYRYDNDGNLIPTPISESMYSYGVTKDTNGKYEAGTVDYSTTFNNDYINHYNSYDLEFNKPRVDVPVGTVVVLKVVGKNATAGSAASLVTKSGFNSKVQCQLLSSTFDSSNSVLVQLTFVDSVTTSEDIGALNLFYGSDNTHTDVSATVQSAVLKETMDTIDYVAKFTLPDGGHYKITYEYVIRDENGNKINSKSVLTLQNDAIIHTSGGDKKDVADKVSYSVQDASGMTSIASGMEFHKVDIGNSSLTDVNAVFVLAHFVEGRWEYGASFPFKEELDNKGNPLKDKNGNIVYSKTEHKIVYGETAIVETGTSGNEYIPDNAGRFVTESSRYKMDVAENQLYKLIEVQAPSNRSYTKTPYERGDKTVAGNAENTQYFVYKASSDQIAALKTAAGLGNDVKVVSIAKESAVMNIENARTISIGAEKIWEQDPESNKNTVRVALQLYRNTIKTAEGAKLVDNQGTYVKDNNFDSVMNAYILDKNADGKWYQDAIWQDLPNGNVETGESYYYFVKETAYYIGDKWYTYDATTGKYLNGSEVYKDSDGNPAEYRPAYTNDAANETGIITVTNSRKLIIKKQWQDVNGNAIAPPVSEIEYALYGIDKDGNETKIMLPTGVNILQAPQWEMEIPSSLLSIDYVRYRIEEITELEDFVVSDVYALNGNVGVVYLINKDSNPSSVNVTATKTWADGNETHGSEDAVTFTLYRYSGSQTVDDAFIQRFISNNRIMSSVAAVGSTTAQPNPVTLDGSETTPWQAEWKELPFKHDGKKLQYFVVEDMTEQTSAKNYTAAYTLNGNTKYLGNRTLDVTNAQPGSLIIKKQWKDETTGSLLTNVNYPEIQLKLYRKADAEVHTPSDDADLTDVKTAYGLGDTDVVTGYTDIEGLSENGIVTLDKDNSWTVSLQGLDTGFKYYIEEVRDSSYPIEIKGIEYANQGQSPGSKKALTAENTVEGRTINVEATKTWVRNDGKTQLPSSITFVLEQNNADASGEWSNYEEKIVTAADNWTAQWTGVPASKSYRIYEKPVTGWTANVTEGTADTNEDGDITQRNFTVTNTLDTGKVKVDKTWYENETGDNTSVTVGLYRKAYNADGTEYRETDGTKNAPKRFSMNSGMISLHKVQNALTQADEPQDAENLNESEEDAQTPVPSMKQMPRFLMNPSMQVLAGAAQAYTDDVTGLKYIKLSEIGEIGVGNSIGLESDLSGKEISKIVIIKDTASANGQIDITSIYQKITAKAIDGTWVTGPEPTEGVYSIQYGNNMYNNTTTVEITPQALPVGQYDGYTSYSNPLKSIVLNQNWSGSVLDVYFYFTPKGPTVQITQPEDQTNLTAVAGDTVPLVGTTSEGTLTWSADPADAVTFSSTTGETVNATFKATGDVTITLTGTDNSGTQGEPVSVTYQVSAFKINDNKINDNQTTPDSRYTITEGETPTLTANGTGYTSWEVTEGGNLADIDSQSGALTVNGASGNFTVTATHGGVTDTMYFTIKGKPLSIEGTAQMHKGMTADLTAKANGEGVAADSWVSSDNGVVTVDGNGKIKAHGTGTATITAMRGDATATHSVEVLDDMKLNLTGGATTSTTHSMSINDSWTVPLVNQIAGIAAQISDPDVAEYRDGKIYTNTTLKDNVTITLTDMDGSGNTVTITLTVKMQEKVVDTAGAEHVCDLNISSTGWTAQSQTDLPLTDGMGHYYRYFIAEKYDDTANYIPISYAENDKQLVKDSVTVLALENYTEETESSSTTLPETGGRGTAIYYTIGRMLLMLGAVGYVTIRRRRWLDG